MNSSNIEHIKLKNIIDILKQGLKFYIDKEIYNNGYITKDKGSIANHHLSLVKKIEELYGTHDIVSKNSSAVLVDLEKFQVLFIDNDPLFFYDSDRLVPTVKLQLKKQLLKRVTVDMGAVRFVTNGADVMRPGITATEEGILSDEYVAVVDEKNCVCLAVCRSLFSAKEMMSMKTGKVLVNIHRVGDEIWNVTL